MFQVRETALGSLRYAGRSKALVEDNVDPQKRGRVRVKHPLLGDLSVWIPYLSSPGTYTVPQIGDVVFIEADSGDYGHPVAWGNLVKKGGGAVPDTFLRSEPTNRGMYTPDNHLFEMDDGQTSEKTDKGIRLTSSGGHKFHLIDDTEKTGILLEDSEGNSHKLDTLTGIWTWDTATGANMTINGQDDILSMTTKAGDTLALSAENGIQMSTPADGGTSASFKSGKIDFVAAAGFTITSDADAAMTITGSLELAATGGFTASTDAAYSITGKTGVTMEDGLGASLAIKDGKFSMKGASGEELLSIIDEIVTKLSTTSAAGFGAPISSVADFIAIKLKLATIKG